MNSSVPSNRKVDRIISTLTTMNSHSFFVRLLTYFIICSSFLAIIVTALQLYWDYKKEVLLLQRSIASIEENVVPSISLNLINLDIEQIRIEANQVKDLLSVEYVGIFSFGNGNLTPVIEVGTKNPRNDWVQFYDLGHKDNKIGRMSIEINYAPIHSKIWEKLVFLLSNQVIMIFLVTACVFFLVYHFVIKHLNRISSCVQEHTLNIADTSDLLILERDGNKDEFDVLITSINTLYYQVYSELAIHQKMISQMEYERDFTRVIVQSSPSLICSLNREFEIQFVNSEVEALLGINGSELVGDNWFEYFVDENVDKENERELINNIPEFDLVFSMEDKEGTQRLLQWRIIDNKEQHGVMCFGIDVTEITNVESQLISLNRELEQKVKDRTYSLEEANQELSATLNKLEKTQESLIEAEKMASLGSLVGGVAHEINTPLGISVTATSFIDEKVKVLQTGFDSGKLSRAQFSKAIDSLKESSQILMSNLSRAEQLVSSFKQVAVDQSSESIYPFNVKENLEKVLLSLSHEIKVASVKVDVECPDHINIESYPSCYIQIYNNLISNSIRHGFDNWEGDKQVSIKVAVSEGDLVIRYRDSGSGIDQDILDRIFEPFVTSKRGKGGSGLGTNIIYNLVNQLLRGKIECFSKIGQGAEFIITLPLEIDFNCQKESA